MFYRPLPERPLTGRDVLAYTLRGNRRDLARRLPAGAPGGDHRPGPAVVHQRSSSAPSCPPATARGWARSPPSSSSSPSPSASSPSCAASSPCACRRAWTTPCRQRSGTACWRCRRRSSAASPPATSRRASCPSTQISAMFFAGVLGLLLGAAFSLVNLVYVRAFSSELGAPRARARSRWRPWWPSAVALAAAPRAPPDHRPCRAGSPASSSSSSRRSPSCATPAPRSAPSCAGATTSSP